MKKGGCSRMQELGEGAAPAHGSALLSVGQVRAEDSAAASRADFLGSNESPQQVTPDSQLYALTSERRAEVADVRFSAGSPLRFACGADKAGGTRQPLSTLVSALLDAVAKYFRITVGRLTRSGACPGLRTARTIAVCLLRFEAGLALSECASLVGGLTVSSAVFACQRVASSPPRSPLRSHLAGVRTLLYAAQADPFVRISD